MIKIFSFKVFKATVAVKLKKTYVPYRAHNFFYSQLFLARNFSL